MVFVNGILNGTRDTGQWYLNGTWLNGILNGPMVFSMVLIRSSSASSSMMFVNDIQNTIDEEAE